MLSLITCNHATVTKMKGYDNSLDYKAVLEFWVENHPESICLKSVDTLLPLHYACSNNVLHLFVLSALQF